MLLRRFEVKSAKIRYFEKLTVLRRKMENEENRSFGEAWDPETEI